MSSKKSESTSTKEASEQPNPKLVVKDASGIADQDAADATRSKDGAAAPTAGEGPDVIVIEAAPHEQQPATAGGGEGGAQFDWDDGRDSRRVVRN